MLCKKHNLEFNEDTHTYVYPLDKSIRFHSVTEIVHAYVPEVTFEQYKHLFKDENRAREKWEARHETSAKAMKFGTQIDKLFQLIYSGNEINDHVAFSKKHYQDFFAQEVLGIKNHYPPMHLQVALCDPKTAVAGTLDLCWYDNGKWYVGDIKTGREPSPISPFGNTLLYPFTHLSNSYASKYTLQLSLYAHLLRVNGNNVSDELTIFQVLKSGNIKTWKLFYDQQIEFMLEMRKSIF